MGGGWWVGGWWVVSTEIKDWTEPINKGLNAVKFIRIACKLNNCLGSETETIKVSEKSRSLLSKFNSELFCSQYKSGEQCGKSGRLA